MTVRIATPERRSGGDAGQEPSAPKSPARAPVAAAETFKPRLTSETLWTAAAVGAAILLSMPLFAVVWLAFSGTESVWPHLAATVLPTALSNTLLVMFGTGALALLIGTAAAWIITMHRFPGRELADRLLVLPLAMPAYIVAYAYVELFDYAGPVQTELRGLFGFQSPADYWFPQIRSLGGVIAIFAFVFYPYVYLTARASFEQQSVCVLEVARTLGRSALQTLWSVALPLARPALAAGSVLVLMECLNDLGAVQYLGVETLSASIYATWMQRGNLPGAAQLAVVMLALIAVTLIGERAARGGGSIEATTGRFRAIPFETLFGFKAALALVAVLTPVFIGFVLPFAVLLLQALTHHARDSWTDYLAAVRNSVVLACVASLATLILALLFAYAARLNKGRLTAIANRIVSLGYALPGTVLAIGLMSPLAGIDNAVDAWMRDTIGISTGLILSGSLFALTLALVIRFLAVALGTIEAGLERISPNLDAAARTLGSSTGRTLAKVHIPLLLPAIGATAMLVFVDVMKELPATLLLRPFNFETLATHIYALTAAERLEEAALGAVTIVVIGIVPVLWLHRAISGGRAGGHSRD